jgi:hypothetical protein
VIPLTEPTFDLNRCIGAITMSLSNKLSSGASQEYRVRFGLGVVEWRVLCQLAAPISRAQLGSTRGRSAAALRCFLTES